MAATQTATGEISIEMSSAASEPASATRRSRSRGADAVALPDTEKKPNILLRCAAFLEWAGNACGALSFLWATVAVLGGFCTLLQPRDFWSTTVIMFMEAFRIFSQDHRLGNRPLFGTTGAIRRLTPHSVLKDHRQEFHAVLAVVSLCDRIINLCPPAVKGIVLIVMAALAVLIANLPFSVSRHLRHHLRLLLSGLLVVLVALSAQWVFKLWTNRQFLFEAPLLAAVLMQITAVLLIILRPPRVTHLISIPLWRKLLYSVKVVLGIGLIVELLSPFMPTYARFIYVNVVKTLVTFILSLSCLQITNSEIAYYWIDIGLSICLVMEWIFSFESIIVNPGVLLVIMICGNLQLPTSIARIVLSSLRLQHQQLKKSYPNPGSPNLLPTIQVFYWMVICQGFLYLCACVIGLFASRLHNQKGLGEVQNEEATVGPQTILIGSIPIIIQSAEEIQPNDPPANLILVGTVPVHIT